MIWTEPFAVQSPDPLPKLQPLVAKALLLRGIHTPAAARAFLDPSAYSPAPASSLPGLTAAADRLVMAIRKTQPICVWGDFDVDGQTATTILFQTLQELGANVKFHIPVRANEGHGVNIPHLREILDQGTRLILTCDTGISAQEAVDYVLSRNVEVIITDHHDLTESLPQAAAIVNPKFLPEGHPLSTLSGSGVAYKLSEELYGRFGRPEEADRQLDLATLGLVGDLIRLTGDSRYLVQRGLQMLKITRRLGLQTMMKMAELSPVNLNEEHISFVLGPRLNALGRLGDANLAVELLTTSDTVRASVLATQLEGLNAQRQYLCNQVTQAAEAQLLAEPNLLAQPVLVLGNPSWPGGVVGIVASRLVERYQKPTILFSTPSGEPARGSARSIEGLNITAAIATQKDLLLNFGGHPMAAGLSLEPENLPEFTRRLGKTMDKMIGESKAERALEIAGWLTLPEITLDLARELERLAPYGPGNERLTLATHALKIQSTTTIGRNQEHLKLEVADNARNSQTVFWWNGAGEKEKISDTLFDLAYSVRASDWRGSPHVQMELVDLRTVDVEKIEVKRTPLEIIDLRSKQEFSDLLASLKGQPSSMLFAEGKERKEIGGKSRSELVPADTLVLWNVPASPEELRTVLAKVQPRTVYLVAKTEPPESAKEFITRLAGLLKFAINHYAGKVAYSELEAATAQRSTTIRKGVRWLVSEGKFSMQLEKEDEIVVSAGNPSEGSSGSPDLWADIQSLMVETAAYRAYFKQADKDLLFN